MKFKTTLKLALLAAFAAQGVYAADSLEDRVSTLENQSGIFRFSGILINRYDNIQTDNVQVLTPLRVYAALNVDAKVNNKLNFYSRFSMSKFMNPVTNQRTTGVSDLSSARAEGGSQMYVERAFLNYKILPSLGFSLGRLPTSDGPPYQLYDDLARQGTYPMMAYSSFLDGAALTYNFNEMLPEGQKLALRAVISPLTNNAQDSSDSVTIPRMGGTNAATTTPAMRGVSPLTAFMADYENTKLGFADKWATILQFVSGSKIQIGDLVKRGTDLGALNTNGVPTATGLTFSGSTLEFDVKTLTLYQELDNIAGSGLSLGLTYFRSMNSSNGLSENNAAIGAASAALKGKGFMTDSGSGSTNGNAFLGTASYHIPVASLSNPVIGIEFLKSTQFHQFFASTLDDMTGLYATRGKMYHAWYTQPISDGLKWRIGYSLQKHEFSKGFFGAPTPGNFAERTVYTQVRLDI